MSCAALRIVVLISGRGSNLQALIDSTCNQTSKASIVAVISNVADAAGLERAKAAGIPTAVVDHRTFPTRLEFDRILQRQIEQFAPELLVLAGFMRVLSAEFVAHFSGRLINIHPSLLPEFTGLNTHQRALQAGASEHGASVHFVTAQLDGGPLIAQATVPVLKTDDEAALAARVLLQEHRLLPWVVEVFADQRLQLAANGQVLFDDELICAPLKPV